MNIKDYLHLYLGIPIRMFNEVTNEWSGWRSLTLSDLNLVYSYNKKIELQLKPVIDMPYYEYSEIDNLKGNTDIGADNNGVYSRPEKVRRYFLTSSAAKTLEAAKRGYDLFGLIEAGLAIDKNNT